MPDHPAQAGAEETLEAFDAARSFRHKPRHQWVVGVRASEGPRQGRHIGRSRETNIRRHWRKS
jgi:predicted NAD-dependent protein-ADP-ribosyltransferase YbiA (DUF1768 family)